MRTPPKDLLTMLRSPAGRALLGRSFIGQAWPILVPVARLYRRTTLRRTHVIAVVGSFGKTTTSRALAAAFGLPMSAQQGWNSWGHVPYHLLRTPRSATHSVHEVGISRPGVMAGYARTLRPDIVVVTSIGSEHQSSLGSIAATRREKARMIEALPREGLAVLNGDDENVRWMASLSSARAITYGFAESNDVRATDAYFDPQRGTRFTLHLRGEAREVTTRLLGRPMVYPILSAVAVASEEERPLDPVLEALSALPPTESRLEPIWCDGATLIVDTYKAALETIERSFELLEEMHAPRKLAVLGEIEEPAGPQGPLYRQLGKRVAGIVSHLVFVGSRKSFKSLAVGAQGAGMARQALVYAGRDPREAAALLRQNLRTGDVVLIKGRMTQHLERTALALMGRPVPCDLSLCRLRPRCTSCPLLPASTMGAGES
jgi:UDP-N-acetylmuramoyl-tripeptide--D-alanyl-D-alanine ligase